MRRFLLEHAFVFFLIFFPHVQLILHLRRSYYILFLNRRRSKLNDWCFILARRLHVWRFLLRNKGVFLILIIIQKLGLSLLLHRRLEHILLL